MEAHEILRISRQQAGYGSAADAANRLGMNEGTYRSHENGSRRIPADAAKKYAKLFKIDVKTLLFPEAGLTREKIINSKPSNTAVIDIPVFAFRAGMGGGGIIIDENPTGYLPVKRSYLRQNRLEDADLMAIDVEGDSMSPTLESGDQVLINRSDKNPARGGIFAIFDSETLVVKRIERIPASEPAMIRLISDNKHHSTYDVIADDTNIIGRVVWYSRRI